jgi:DNA-binding MarR family transcriptional regulator
MTSAADLEAASTLRRGANRLTRRLRAERPAGALSTSKLAVLADLHRHGEQTPGELAAIQRVQPQSLTRVIAELAKAGLVARRPDKRDRRQARLQLTAKGLDALRADMEVRDRWLAAALTRLTPAESALLYAAGELMERIAEQPTSAD